LTPAKLPEDLITELVTRLRDLKPGESAWIEWIEMRVDLEHRCVLNPNAKIKKEGHTIIRATCTEAGFEVLIPASQIPLRWTPGEFSIGEGDFPVLKLERMAPEPEY
jgi:hypothetical protein